MDSSLSVALVLSAVNNMGPSLTSAVRQVREVEDSINRLGNASPTGKWDDKFFDDQLSKMKEWKTESEKLKSSGKDQMLKGFVELSAVKQAVDSAADFEKVMKQVELANYDATVPLKIQEEQLKNLSDLSLKLGADTVFSNTDAAKAELNLIKNGMEYKEVLEGGAKAAVYLAQTAEISCDSAADAISQVTNMFQLQGSQMMQTADDINRAANASSAGVQNIMHDLQQTGQTAHNLGINIKDTTLLLGTLHNMGLGDASGTFLNDLLLRLDAVSPEAEKALYSLGLLQGATVQKTKTGKTKIVGGESSIFDESGHVKNAQDLVNKLRQTLYNAHIDPKQMFDSSGNMLSDDELEKLFGAKKANEVLNQFKKAFGVQGMRAAIALTVSGKGSFEDMTEKAGRAKAIEQQVQEMQSTFSGIVEQIKGSLETLLTSAGTPFMNELKKYGDSIVNVINSISAWVAANPQAAASILKVVAGLAAFNLGAGAVKLLFGNVLGVLSSGGTVFLNLAKYFKGFGESFSFLTKVMGGGKISSFFRAFTFGTKLDGVTKGIMSLGSKTGGIFKSIGSGALNASKSIGRVGSEFVKTGGRAVAAGAKMAGVWLKAAGTSALSAIRVIGNVGLEFLKTGVKAGIAGAKMAGAWLKAAGAGALSAIKTIISVGAQFLATGAKALIAGAKMALAWVIGLGPIGIIIAVITAIVVAAVLAWKTNFLGFRDKVQEIFGAIGSFIGGIVDGVKNAWNSAISWISNELDKLFGYAKKLLDNPIVKGIISGAKWVGGKIEGLVTGKSEDTIKNSNSSSYSDNRNITYNINSTDPRLAAAQISNNDDKYVKSRDPRLAY
ncbi:phage tail tape measure protein [Clostridium lundense]|uniref:phage tail tape measure protein n=1 Tax=Clostridium lundense TaxID=319475 RepID=UPI0006855B43|nr:phage tail tape measure protein [Clostridium lundense]